MLPQCECSRSMQVTRSRLDSLDDDDSYSDGAEYVSCEETLPSMYQSEKEQQKPLISSYDSFHGNRVTPQEETLPSMYQSEKEQQKPLISSYDVKHPVHDGFPSQPPGNEQLQYPLQQQQQQLVSAENGDLQKTVENQQLPGTIIEHVGKTEIETKERLSEKDQGVTERLRNESRKNLKRLDETLLVGVFRVYFHI